MITFSRSRNVKKEEIIRMWPKIAKFEEGLSDKQNSKFFLFPLYLVKMVRGSHKLATKGLVSTASELLRP